jgi:hypothetical protein
MISKGAFRIGICFLATIVVGILCSAPASMASTLPGSFSAGLGGGFGDEDMGPIVVSAKFWSRSWEAGGEVFYDGDTGDTIDQIALAWVLYRFDLHSEERNYMYAGLGPGNVFNKNKVEDSFGIIGSLGWDGKDYGLQFKYGYFDPSIYSFVVYWHF